ncbi:putative pectinesterase/pectinesterase inhibitor 13 [Morus notabilis]|uniref:Putative pectinesterase/pectinesterase inhibitor 13 n=1 Tax=Morus notabilis TaxID=981085 RepID=W9S723_9ROSA|nr:putative pectinesterase/pectinesterase inhibitor 13 [Morus notabilis]
MYKSIGEALAAYPKDLKGRYVIYVKAGVYDEYITVTKNQVNVFIYGDGRRKTIVTGRKNFRDGVSTFKTATFSAVGNGFIAKSIGFQNTAGAEGHQGVAVRVQSDMVAFYNCRMDSYQDTLYVQAHRQFYRNCVISGTVDFIFADASAIIQNCLIIYSRTVIMETTMGDLIQPVGWMEWNGNFALDTLYYREYANRGPGAGTDKRVKWRGYKVITDRNEALHFTPGPFIQGNLWLRYTGAPYFLGFKP